MVKKILLASLLVVLVRLDAVSQWVEGFSFQKKTHDSKGQDSHERKSVMSQLKSHQGEDADFMTAEELREFNKKNNQKERTLEETSLESYGLSISDHHELPVESAEHNVWHQWQQFFMKIFAKLFDKN